MFSFFRSSKAEPDLSFIGVDMHNHLLPGLDDGLGEPEKTIEFIKELKALGYKKLICTPHIISDMYPNGPHTILPKLELVRSMLAEQNIDMPIEAGAEYMIDTDFEAFMKEGGELLTFGNNYMLIEMSYIAASHNIEQVIFQLRMKGIKPILAHPERYTYYHHTFDQYRRFIDLGCILQVNLLSLLGYYGEPVRRTAERLFKEKMVTMLGTDMHHETHLQALKDLASKKSFYKLLENYDIQNSKLLLG